MKALERKFYIICGHYGCGKSNFSLNLAIERAKLGRKVMLLDLDLVNPYFLSSGYKEELEKMGIEVIAPLYANTNVETPALPANLNLIFSTDADVVMDVGGDDAGSVVLGRYFNQLSGVNYELLYVINHYRNLTATPEETVEILREIEAASRCKACGIVDNSHLKYETTWEVKEAAFDYVDETVKLTGLPLVATTIPAFLYKDDRLADLMQRHEERKWYPVEIYVRAPWEDKVILGEM